MVRLSNRQIEEILTFVSKLTGSREEIDRLLKSIYLRLGDDSRGTEFKRELSQRLDTQRLLTVAPNTSEDDLAKAAKIINDPALIYATAKGISPNKRKEYFPDMVSQFENVEEAGAGGAPPAAGGATSTANVAAYPVPIGEPDSGAQRKRKKKKKR